MIAQAARVEAVRAKWEATFETVEPYVGTVLAVDVEKRVRDLARRYLDGRAALFDHRIAQSKVVDGHGDLLADDIFCLDDGPRVLDCVEFDDELRYGDVLADVCFLAMDLERIGAADLGARFMSWYRELSAETYPSMLAEHYIAFRAHIRTMVACLRAEQGDDAAARQASLLLGIARDHLERGQVALLLVGGLPGTGKSTLAAGLADRLGWSVLRSDEVRKDLAGIGHTERADAGFREGLYGPEATAATYRELLDRARRLLELGEPVVLDASWTDARHRAAAAEVAQETCSELVEIECTAPAEVAAERLRSRGAADVSDATPTVAAAMANTADSWPSAQSIDTTTPPDVTLTQGQVVVRERSPHQLLAVNQPTRPLARWWRSRCPLGPEPSLELPRVTRSGRTARLGGEPGGRFDLRAHRPGRELEPSQQARADPPDGPGLGGPVVRVDHRDVGEEEQRVGGQIAGERARRRDPCR